MRFSAGPRGYIYIYIYMFAALGDIYIYIYSSRLAYFTLADPSRGLCVCSFSEFWTPSKTVVHFSFKTLHLSNLLVNRGEEHYRDALGDKNRCFCNTDDTSYDRINKIHTNSAQNAVYIRCWPQNAKIYIVSVAKIRDNYARMGFRVNFWSKKYWSDIQNTGQ